MARVLIASSPDFVLKDALQMALAVDDEEFDESQNPQGAWPPAGDSQRQSEGLSSVEPPPEAGEAGGGQGQTRKNVRRRMSRMHKQVEQGRTVRKKSARKHMPEAPLMESVAELVHLPVTACGYHGVNEGKQRLGGNYVVEELLELGFTEVEWDGVTPQVIVEGTTKKTMVILAGQPDDPTYRECQARVTEKMLKVGEAAAFEPEELDHCRASNSAALNHGVFHGQGTPHPLNLSNGDRTELLNEFCEDPDVRRMAHFADASFQTWSPRVYEEVKGTLNSLYARNPSLSKPFPLSVYPCAAFNFGPQVCCKGHRDSSNYPPSWCAIQALGNFDHRRGGHLVLKELKLFVQFPPGSTALIPSALITHGNTPVAKGEVRLSFTQFCPGGLIRWVDNGFQTQKDMERRLSKKKFLEKMKFKETRWEKGMNQICTLDELKKEYAELKGQNQAELNLPGEVESRIAQ